MPLMSSLSWYIWVAVIAAQTILFAVMAASGKWRTWPSIFAFLGAQASLSAALLSIVLFSGPTSRPALYFYTYWSGAIVTQAIEIAVIVQISNALVGVSSRMRRRIAIGVPALAAFNLGWSLVLSLEAKAPLCSAIVRAVSLLNETVALSWTATFLLIAMAVDLMGIQWPLQAERIAVGLVVELAGTTACTWLSGPHLKSSTLSEIKGVIYLGVLLIWALSLWGKNDDTLPGIDAVTLGSYIQTYLAALRRIKERTL